MPPLPVIREEETSQYEEEEEEATHASEPLLVDHAHSKEAFSLSEDEEDEQRSDQRCMKPSSGSSRILLALLQRYNKYMQTSIGKDRGMKLLQWTLALLGTWLKLKRQRRQVQSNQCDGRSGNSLLLLEQGSLKLATALCWARYCSRVFDLPAALEAVWTNGWAAAGGRGLQGSLGRGLALSMVGYYPTELIAFVHWMIPSLVSQPGADKRTAERWSYISCRFWCVYLIFESVQCLLLYQQLQSEKEALCDEDKERGIALQERRTKLQLVRNALFVLPSLHWSLHDWDTKPWLNEQFVNVLMWIESVVCLTQ